MDVNRPRVVLVDDHPIWQRDGVRSDLGEGFDVVGEAANAKEAIEVIRATRPDLVVCDLQIPDGGGIAVVRACADTPRVVMLTVSEQERDLLDAVGAGRGRVPGEVDAWPRAGRGLEAGRRRRARVLSRPRFGVAPG